MNKTPEEEATEIVNKMLYHLGDYDDVGEDAKQCALIAVDLVLNALPMYTGAINPKWEHYQKVKVVIEAKT